MDGEQMGKNESVVATGDVPNRRSPPRRVAEAYNPTRLAAAARGPHAGTLARGTRWAAGSANSLLELQGVYKAHGTPPEWEWRTAKGGDGGRGVGRERVR